MRPANFITKFNLGMKAVYVLQVHVHLFIDSNYNICIERPPGVREVMHSNAIGNSDVFFVPLNPSVMLIN